MIKQSVTIIVHNNYSGSSPLLLITWVPCRPPELWVGWLRAEALIGGTSRSPTPCAAHWEGHALGWGVSSDQKSLSLTGCCRPGLYVPTALGESAQLMETKDNKLDITHTIYLSIHLTLSKQSALLAFVTTITQS